MNKKWAMTKRRGVKEEKCTLREVWVTVADDIENIVNSAERNGLAFPVIRGFPPTRKELLRNAPKDWQNMRFEMDKINERIAMLSSEKQKCFGDAHYTIDKIERPRGF